jgi:hypothetical protein
MEDCLGFAETITGIVEDALAVLPACGGVASVQDAVCASDSKAVDYLNRFFRHLRYTIVAGDSTNVVDRKTMHVLHTAPSLESEETWQVRLSLDPTEVVIDTRKWSSATERLLVKAGFKNLTVQEREPKEFCDMATITCTFTLPAPESSDGDGDGEGEGEGEGGEALVKDEDTGLQCTSAAQLARVLHEARREAVMYAVRDTCDAVVSGMQHVLRFQYGSRNQDTFHKKSNLAVPGYTNWVPFWRVLGANACYADIDVSDVGFIVRANDIMKKKLADVQAWMGVPWVAKIKAEITHSVCHRMKTSGYDVQALQYDILVLLPSAIVTQDTKRDLGTVLTRLE